MKRLIFPLLPLLLLAAVAAGCKKDTTDAGRYEPTRPGYYLFERTHDQLLSAARDLWPVLLLSRYLDADDAERERLHDTFLYTRRIVRHGDEWRIIDTHSEIIIQTGGTGLYARNARWTYRYAGRTYPGTEFPTLVTRPAAGDDAAGATGTLQTTLLLPDAAGTVPQLTGELDIESGTEVRETAPGRTLETFVVRFSGTATARTDDVEIGCTIDSPLQYGSADDLFEAGSMTLTTLFEGQTETATARLLPDYRVAIEYNGHREEWNWRYPHYYYAE